MLKRDITEAEKAIFSLASDIRTGRLHLDAVIIAGVDADAGSPKGKLCITGCEGPLTLAAGLILKGGASRFLQAAIEHGVEADITIERMEDRSRRPRK